PHRPGTLAADVAVMLVEVPQPPGPAADEPLPRHERPVVVPDLIPQLRGEPRQADRARVPAVSGALHRRLARLPVRLRDLEAARLDGAFAIGRQLPAAFLDE